jgi:predicted enzyme related to lactoylglutathione lyase
MLKLVNFHLPARDIPRAVEFYRTVFGWAFADRSVAQTPYFVASPDGPGVEVAITSASPTIAAPVPTFEVIGIDDAMARIAVNGGRQARVDDIPGIGRFGYAIDSEGNVIALLERERPNG